MKDALGDRMKAYEAQTASTLNPYLPFIVRVDGRAFSSFTRDMKRPFDPTLALCMIETGQRLVERTPALLSYVQSDEISLVFHRVSEAEQPFFGGSIQKLCSIFASLTTALFLDAIRRNYNATDTAKLFGRLPHFDARVFPVPSRSEAANAILWRTNDAYRNAVSMAAQSVYSHRELQHKSRDEMLVMLTERGINFSAYPSFFRFGTFSQRRSVQRALTEDEWSRIPEDHRPDRSTEFIRHETYTFSVPFTECVNRTNVIFDKTTPILRGDTDDCNAAA